VERRPPSVPGPRFNDLATAVLYKDPKGVAELLAFGKWPDKPDSRGVTPLMLAAELGDAESAEALLKAGADPNRPGPGGDTATSIARERRHGALLGLLQRFGGK
jgi:ankyrin repeat protein